MVVLQRTADGLGVLSEKTLFDSFEGLEFCILRNQGINFSSLDANCSSWSVGIAVRTQAFPILRLLCTIHFRIEKSVLNRAIEV